ncbi:hypothetical protein BHECKSOX2_299 [Bathymodiolus heckerae thiotrophic gill symbiont]|nr:hypothetical protein BHECKSOX2_299 [Bathymodiolus heckerae thiotrophic gill symbiont]
MLIIPIYAKVSIKHFYFVIGLVLFSFQALAASVSAELVRINATTLAMRLDQSERLILKVFGGVRIFDTKTLKYYVGGFNSEVRRHRANHTNLVWFEMTLSAYDLHRRKRKFVC